MMTNRRCLNPLAAKRELGRAGHAPALLTAAVAYLDRWATMRLKALRFGFALAWMLLGMNGWGQGQFYFNNRDPAAGVDARFYATWQEANEPISSVGSPDWEVQLFFFNSVGQLLPLEPSTTGFRGAPGSRLSGYVEPITVTVPGVPPGSEMVRLLFRFVGPGSFYWDLGAEIGSLGGGPVVPPTLPLGSLPIVLQPLPEPQTSILALLAGGVMCAFMTMRRGCCEVQRTKVV